MDKVIYGITANAGPPPAIVRSKPITTPISTTATASASRKSISKTTPRTSTSKLSTKTGVTYGITANAGPPPVISSRAKTPSIVKSAPAPTPRPITRPRTRPIPVVKPPSVRAPSFLPASVRASIRASFTSSAPAAAAPPPVVAAKRPSTSTPAPAAPPPPPPAPIVTPKRLPPPVAPKPLPAPAPVATPVTPKRLPPPVAPKPLPPPKFIAEGSFGCVFSPPIECAEPCVDERCKTGIAKLMTTVDADKERSEYIKNNLSTIDPAGRYYIKEPYTCNPKLPLHNHTELPNKDGESCSKLTIANKKILIYDNGGMDLYTLYKDIMQEYRKHNNSELLLSNIKYILRKLENIFDGVALLNENNVYHFDIKPENIVTGINHNNFDLKHLPEDNIFRLIDFGIANKFENRDLAGNEIVEQVNFVRPLDIVYLSGLPLDDVNTIILSGYQILGLTEIKYYYSQENNVDSPRQLVSKILRPLNEYYNNASTTHNKDQFIEKIFRTIDTFGLGAFLLFISMNIDLNLILRPLADQLYNFVVTNNLMNFNPFERPLVNGPDGVAQKYKQFLRTL